jgi:spore maturation protein CgeB
MKILVVGPESGDCFAHNVAHTLRRMGHEVRSAPRPELLQSRGRVARGADELLGRLSAAWRERAERRAVRLAGAWRPELCLFTTGTLEPWAVEEMRRVSGGRAVLWFGDSAANLRRGHATSGEYDAVFFKDRDFVRRLRDVLGLEAFYLPEACNPEWHRPVARREGRRVLVAGTCYGYRNRLVERLRGRGVDVVVHGPAPPSWAPRSVAAAHAGTYLDETTKAAAFGKALACLASFAPAESPATVNCRVFEIAACGGALLAEARPALEEFFEPEREYLPFADLEQCLQQLARLERDEAAARELRRRAARRAHAEHSYERRLSGLLETLGRVR